MSEQQEMTVDQYMVNQTIDNLAKTNANQALQIANLQAQVGYLKLQLEQSQNAEEDNGVLPGEHPIDPDSETPEIGH